MTFHLLTFLPLMQSFGIPSASSRKEKYGKGIFNVDENIIISKDNIGN